MTVFISYSHTDSAFVDKLSARLIEKNIKVWKDQWKTLAGDSFVKKIKDGIEGASYFCIVLSNNSLKSKWVNEELRLALEEESRENQFTILPILLDECEIPSVLIHRIYADFRSSFDAGLKQVLAVVGKRYNIGEAGRIKGESPYFIDYGVEEKLIDGRFFLQVDVVSFDKEESFSILSQFIFRGNEYATAEYLGLEEGMSLRDFVFIACADEFEANPARINVHSMEANRSRFSIEDADKKARIDVSVRVKWLGNSARETVLFDVGALIKQICVDYGLK